MLFLKRFAILTALSLASTGCAGAEDTPTPEDMAPPTSATAGPLGPWTPAGTPPATLPGHLMVGLFSGRGDGWAAQSGVPWDARYVYLTAGWPTWSSKTGGFALDYMNECATGEFLPVIELYQMNDEPGGNETAFLAKAQNAQTMTSYFADVKKLMEQAKAFAKPVVVLIEADGFGFLEQQSQGNPTTMAAVASTGLPELAGLPDTLAGWGLAFLQMRKAVGASNVVLGMHISAWSTDHDVANSSGALPDGDVAAGYQFHAPLGLASNVTGQTYDLIVGDPSDRDADYYLLVKGMGGHWWDTADTASLYTASFNRYAQWLHLWNLASQRRWMLWQIPLGNANHLDVENTGKPREGYKDNRAEFFLGTGSETHRLLFAQAGVVALLFGAGLGGQSTYTNDIYTDNQLFLKTHAAAYWKAGALPLP